jgi:hypothetical protein
MLDLVAATSVMGVPAIAAGAPGAIASVVPGKNKSISARFPNRSLPERRRSPAIAFAVSTGLGEPRKSRARRWSRPAILPVGVHFGRSWGFEGVGASSFVRADGRSWGGEAAGTRTARRPSARVREKSEPFGGSFSVYFPYERLSGRDFHPKSFISLARPRGIEPLFSP